MGNHHICLQTSETLLRDLLLWHLANISYPTKLSMSRCNVVVGHVVVGGSVAVGIVAGAVVAAPGQDFYPYQTTHVKK